MKHRLALPVVLLLLVSLAAAAPDSGKSVVTPQSAVKWSPAGIPGVSIAPVEGDPAKGPAHFFLKYDPGLVTPAHHHSPDHYVTVVSGTLTLTVDGKENRLGPGSFFALVGQKPHVARVEGQEPAVMLVDAGGAWDVVPEATQEAKK